MALGLGMILVVSSQPRSGSSLVELLGVALRLNFKMLPVIHLLRTTSVSISPLVPALSERESHRVTLRLLVAKIITMSVIQVVGVVLPEVLNSFRLDSLLRVRARVVTIRPRETDPIVLIIAGGNDLVMMSMML